MDADPGAFRIKYRKMAADPFAFYRGTACLFHRDLAAAEQPWADERTGRVWIHGDLHPENFGTYVNSHGELVFDVNDFDEAYVGPFTWACAWDGLYEPAEMEDVVIALGHATAKIHCVGDADSEHTIVDVQTEEAIAEVLRGREEEFVEEVVDFGVEYAERVRADHGLFVEAFREGRIGDVDAI